MAEIARRMGKEPVVRVRSHKRKPPARSQIPIQRKTGWVKAGQDPWKRRWENGDYAVIIANYAKGEFRWVLWANRRFEKGLEGSLADAMKAAEDARRG
jgi:hypothetical protein